jgi:hypothetical protein
MDGSNDFHPEAKARASDPSLEEILRRARDARLGGRLGTNLPFDVSRRVSLLTANVVAIAHSWAQDWRYFVAGILIGVSLTCAVMQSWVAGNRDTQPSTASAPAAPIATDTAVPVSPPPTTDDISALVRDYYDHESQFAGERLLTAVDVVQIQYADATQLTACVEYDSALVSSPDMVDGTNSRTFTLASGPEASGEWCRWAIRRRALCRNCCQFYGLSHF